MTKDFDFSRAYIAPFSTVKHTFYETMAREKGNAHAVQDFVFFAIDEIGRASQEDLNRPKMKRVNGKLELQTYYYRIEALKIADRFARNISRNCGDHIKKDYRLHANFFRIIFAQFVKFGAEEAGDDGIISGGLVELTDLLRWDLEQCLNPMQDQRLRTVPCLHDIEDGRRIEFDILLEPISRIHTGAIVVNSKGAEYEIMHIDEVSGMVTLADEEKAFPLSVEIVEKMKFL